MGKSRSIKFFSYILDFKLKKKADKEKLIFLADMLSKELIAQGYDTSGSTDGCDTYITIMDFGHDLTIRASDEYVSLKNKERGIE